MFSALYPVGGVYVKDDAPKLNVPANADDELSSPTAKTKVPLMPVYAFPWSELSFRNFIVPSSKSSAIPTTAFVVYALP